MMNNYVKYLKENLNEQTSKFITKVILIQISRK